MPVPLTSESPAETLNKDLNKPLNRLMLFYWVQLDCQRSDITTAQKLLPIFAYGNSYNSTLA
jgi:hypothetical protein